jgi:DNA-binding IclR family transcriptional regulator
MPAIDDKARRIMEAIRRARRPYRDADICMATRLSKAVVRKRLQALEDAGLARQRWVGEREPFWEATT